MRLPPVIYPLAAYLIIFHSKYVPYIDASPDPGKREMQYSTVHKEKSEGNWKGKGRSGKCSTQGENSEGKLEEMGGGTGNAVVHMEKSQRESWKRRGRSRNAAHREKNQRKCWKRRGEEQKM
jgi:hypothetical protein